MGDWIKKPVGEMIEEIVGAKAFLVNDSDLVGLGEACFGGGKDKENVVYITVSTGVGGAKIVKGKIDANVSNFEPGKQVIDAGHTLCENSNPPYDLQSFIGGQR